MKVLIIDDEIDNRNLLATILEPHGECDMAEDGSEGIEAYRKSIAENKRYDLITLDMLMPKMNGHETIQKIREIEKTSGIEGDDRVKVIMISANNDYETIMQSLGQCSAYIEKPIVGK